MKKYEKGDLPSVDWLDKLAFRRMEEIHAEEAAKSEHLFLYIDLPRFDFPIVFTEPVRIFPWPRSGSSSHCRGM